MKALLERLFIKHWPRKLVALATAILVWLLVSQTITVTRTLADVPVRIVNLPPDKTAIGLLPNGLLNKRISVTLSGTKSVIQELRSSDIEIVINADGRNESWIATISKRNLVPLNQEFDLRNEITEVTANDQFIKLSNLITDEIPVLIKRPIGDPPKGYQYLDVWPKNLTQKVTGPEEQVKELKLKGIELTFHLNRISQEDLDQLSDKQKKDEITFLVPNSWKKVPIPFKDMVFETLNDPRAEMLRIDFLKQELIALGTELPVTIFFPLKHSQTINPENFSLATNSIIQKKNGLKLLTLPLFVRDVSHLFLDTVRDRLLLIVVAEPKSESSSLHWAIECVDEKDLEDIFVNASSNFIGSLEDSYGPSSDQIIRYRFRDYVRKLELFTEDGHPFHIRAELLGNTITIEQVP